MDEEKKELVPYYKTLHLAKTVNDVANGTMAGYLPDSIRRELREAADILSHVVLLRCRQCLTDEARQKGFYSEYGVDHWFKRRMINTLMEDIGECRNVDEAFKFYDMKYDKERDMYSKEMDFMLVLQPKEEN